MQAITSGMMNEIKRITDSKDAITAAANIQARLSKSVVDVTPVDATHYAKEPATAGLSKIPGLSSSFVDRKSFKSPDGIRRSR